MDYQTARNKLGDRTSRKLENNTYLQQHGEAYAIRLHATDILTFRPDSVELNSGGWRTVTTKARINTYVPGRGITQKAGIWYFSDGSLFVDGCRVSYDTGLPLKPVKPADTEKRVKALKRRIARYVKGFCAHIQAGKLERPGPGDCWGCLMVDSNGKTVMGTDHLLQHFGDTPEEPEPYYVPSLLFNAIKEKGYREPGFIFATIQAEGTNGKLFWATAKVLRDYLTKQLVTQELTP